MRTCLIMRTCPIQAQGPDAAGNWCSPAFASHHRQLRNKSSKRRQHNKGKRSCDEADCVRCQRQLRALYCVLFCCHYHKHHRSLVYCFSSFPGGSLTLTALIHSFYYHNSLHTHPLTAPPLTGSPLIGPLLTGNHQLIHHSLAPPLNDHPLTGNH